MILGTIKEFTLNNGLKILCLKKPGAPVVAAQIWYKVGSAYEKHGIRGLSHILEHMMFRGSKNVSPEEHARRINDVGGHCNAGTAEDVTMYINSVPKEHLRMALELEADRMTNLTLDPELFETERNVIVEEYHTYMNMPVTKAFLEFREALYDGHAYAMSPLGTYEDISNVSIDQCREYYAEHYTPDNSVLAVVGDIEDEKTVFAMAAEIFGGINTKKPKGSSDDSKQVSTATKTAIRRAWMKRKVDFDVPMLITGYLAPSSAGKDALPLDILQMIMSQGETSRLHREVVRKSSLAVMAGGMNHFLRRSGMSLFFAAFTPDVSVKKLDQCVSKELARVLSEGVTPEELEKVRNATLTSRTMELYSAENICQRLAYGETVEGDYNLWVQRLEALENLSSESLVETARNYWTPEKRQTLYLKPRKTRPLLYVAGLARRLLRFGQ